MPVPYYDIRPDLFQEEPSKSVPEEDEELDEGKGRTPEEDQEMPGYSQTASAGVPQQGQDRGTTAPQSGLMRITHGDQSYLADPMSGQNYSAPGQLLQQQQPQQQGAPISPEMRAAWPYLNNQQRAAMLQHREQTQNQAWLNQQKLTQAEKMRKAKLEQQKSAIMNGPYSDNEKAEYTRLLDIPLEVLNKKEAQEKIAKQQQERKEFEDLHRWETIDGLSQQNITAQTMKHREVRDDDGNLMGHIIGNKIEYVPGYAHKGAAGAGKAHDHSKDYDAAVKANTVGTGDEKKINWPGVAKQMQMGEKHRAEEAEKEAIAKLPGEERKQHTRQDGDTQRITFSTGDLEDLRTAALRAHEKKDVDAIAAMRIMDKILRKPEQFRTKEEQDAYKAARARAAIYLSPDQPATGASGEKTVPKVKAAPAPPAKVKQQTVQPFDYGAGAAF